MYGEELQQQDLIVPVWYRRLMRQRGISIPRVSWNQGAAGVEVSASEALPGDIVYYGWHVGIYIGNGQMIHAPEEGDVVKISTVDWAAHTFVRCW